MSKFNIYKNSDTGTFYFALVTDGGTSVLRSPNKTRKHDVKRSIATTKNAIKAGRFYNSSMGDNYGFTVNGRNKKVLANSKTWNRSSDATKAITNLKRTITCATIVDKTK